MGCNQVGLLLIVVVLVVVLDCGYGDTQRIRKIVTMRSNAVTRIEDSEPVLHRDARSVHRSRRLVLNSVEIQQALDTHNTGRRKVGASDANLMTWNDYLASMAYDWATNCQWKHGQPSRDPSTLPYNPLGQNLYAISGTSTINITAALLEWYNEYIYYDYNTLQCQPWQQCGHYTQMVWASSRELGCAYASCPTLGMSNFTSSALYLVCNYGPSGNFPEQKPFQMGAPCSRCDTGYWWCNSGLCDRSCTATGPTCACSPACQNSGSVVASSCSCSCAPGWYGSDCSVVCMNMDPLCDPQPGQSGYPPEYCTRSDYGALIRQKCPKMCGLCRTNTACSVTCKNYGTLNYATCTCSCAPGWYGSDCSANTACPVTCKNYGTLNSATCTCSCAPGWYGSDCSVCADQDSLCDPQPGQAGYPPDYCSNSVYGPTIRVKCPKMCGVCQASGANSNYSTATTPLWLSMLAVSWLLLRFRNH